VAGWKPRGVSNRTKVEKRLRHAGDPYSIQLDRCITTSEKGTPMMSIKRALKAVALAAMLTAVLLLSSGCLMTANLQGVAPPVG
jgi:hypothetical protein